jgi:hypothetical protein
MTKTIYNLWNNPWQMAGTEGSFEYTVQSASLRGRVGQRELNGIYRIRVEPAPEATASTIATMAEHMPRAQGWKQPGDDVQNRFSIVVSGSDQAHLATMLAETALGESELKSFERNPELSQQADAEQKPATVDS